MKRFVIVIALSASVLLLAGCMGLHKQPLVKPVAPGATAAASGA